MACEAKEKLRPAVSAEQRVRGGEVKGGQHEGWRPVLGLSIKRWVGVERGYGVGQVRAGVF